jgi:hypothetical protein
MKMTEELKRCPFCGSEIRHVESLAKSFDPPRLYHEWHHVLDNADDCPIRRHVGLIVASATDDEKMQGEAVRRWNTRQVGVPAQRTTAEFTNELGNLIRITIEGPTSLSTNDLTPLETSKLNDALNRHLAVQTKEHPDELKQLVGELEAWPATGRGDGMDAAVVRKLMKRASAAIVSMAGVPAEGACTNEECRLIADENADNVRLLDWISDKIGLPHDEELSEVNFSAWLDRRSPAVKSTQWCPGCSRDVEKACHHFQCPLGPNRSQPETDVKDLAITTARHGLAELFAEIEQLRAQVARAQSLPDAWEQKAKRSEHVVYDADMLNECAVELRESLTSTENNRG